MYYGLDGLMDSAHFLKGRRALVTGAGRGIGRTIALALAEAGADVAVTARTRSEIEQVAADIKALGRSSIAVTCDVTFPEEVDQMAAAVTQSFGTVDIVINNAGSGKSHKFLGHPNG